MRDFKQNRIPGGGGNFGNRSGGRSFGGGRDRGRPEMHKATCSECGNSCEVPFKPTGNKPVLCNDCFGGSKSGGGNRDRGRDRGRSSGRDFGRDRREDRQMFKAVCADCGDNCEVPFKPSGDKPVLCSNCFGGNAPSRKPEQSNEKQDEILAKLDKILNILQRTNSVKEVTIMKAKTEPKPEPKVEKKKEKAVKKATPKKAVKKTATKKKAPVKKK